MKGERHLRLVGEPDGDLEGRPCTVCGEPVSIESGYLTVTLHKTGSPGEPDLLGSQACGAAYMLARYAHTLEAHGITLEDVEEALRNMARRGGRYL